MLIFAQIAIRFSQESRSLLIQADVLTDSTRDLTLQRTNNFAIIVGLVIMKVRRCSFVPPYFWFNTNLRLRIRNLI